MSPAAKAPRRPTTSWSAMAAVGGSLVRDDIERQSPGDCGGRPGRDGRGGGRARAVADIGKSRPRGDLPDRRIEPEKALSAARHQRPAKPDSVAAGALVYRRRTLRAAG